jgi:Glycosyl hydrolases family 43
MPIATQYRLAPFAAPKLRVGALLLAVVLAPVRLAAADPWVADLGNGRYRNPILFADYSDPDVVRVGEDFYMVASSFNAMPGIPVLRSKDLVNWTIVGHVYESLPFQKFDKPAHGEGAWAPSSLISNRPAMLAASSQRM